MVMLSNQGAKSSHNGDVRVMESANSARQLYLLGQEWISWQVVVYCNDECNDQMVGYVILMKQEKILDAITIAEIHNKNHETAMADHLRFICHTANSTNLVSDFTPICPPLLSAVQLQFQTSLLIALCLPMSVTISSPTSVKSTPTAVSH